ncbi:MAG: hypothetical protein Q8K30_01010 [Candidatus Gracilibacteria bacterium]|nr:hypothetical protein [Candidatus Gracilibacteria bacterium]
MNNISDKYTETENNGIKTISFGGIDFIGTDLLTSTIGNVYDLLNGNRKTEIFKFDGKREFYRFHGNYFLVKYSDKSIRDRDKEILKKEGKFNKYGKTEKNEEGFQIPLTDLVVDYNGSYYLMIEGTLLLDENLTDINKGVFKSMIVDFEKFNGISIDMDTVIKSSSDKVSDLISLK